VTEPAISVVVPTHRRPGLLRQCLRGLAEQDLTLDRFEVIVVDDGSADTTPAVIERARRALPNLVPLTQAENRGPAAARNRGIAAARAPLVLFLDDDVVAAPNLLETHLQLHTPAVPDRGVLGRVDWHPTLRPTPFMRWLDASGLQFGYETWLQDGPVEPPWAAFYTANVSVPRQTLLDAGGFDERFPYAAYEDMELAWRMTKDGFILDYRSEAVAYHARPIALRDFKARMTRVAESAALFRALCPDVTLADRDLARWQRSISTRAALAVAALPARVAKAEGLLGRHFKAEVAAAYRAGQERVARSTAKVAPRSATPPSRWRPDT